MEFDYARAMQGTFVTVLRSRRADIRSRWEDLLRAERCTSPLANPDALVHLLDLTLDELLASLTAAETFPRRFRRSTFQCPCGRNPLIAYFNAGRQATREALVLSQASNPVLTPGERDSSFEALEAVFGNIADRELEAFCAVCQHRLPDVAQQGSMSSAPSSRHDASENGA